MNILAIIPAKHGSKRLPGKNWRKLNGKPLFMWSVDAARGAGLRAVVSTDSPEVRAICETGGVECLPEEVREEKMEHCVRQVLDQVGWNACEAVVILQPTSPFRSAAVLRRAIAHFDGRTPLVSVTPHRPLMWLDGNVHFDPDDRKISQHETRWAQILNGNMFITPVEFFRRRGILFDDKPHHFIETDQFAMFEIHTRHDFRVADVLAKLPEAD